jgi:single-stranded-DNA-specific exonuclease
VAEPVDPALAAQVPETSRMIAHLLFQRGYKSAEAIRAFLSGPPVEYDPFLMPDMARAVERIRRAAESREKVAVYGDFDCDGLTAAAILFGALELLGLEPTVIIPTRDEGHGLRDEHVRTLKDAGVTLVVTTDCGISDVQPISTARSLGMDVIVTDHHEPASDGTLPDALVVSATRAGSTYPFRGLSGAGVAYKVAEALLGRNAAGDFLDLATLGTIADVVPLVDENRGLVLRGLDRLRTTPRAGLRALFTVAGVDSRYIDSASVGYYLGPRINAANRLADPMTAFQLIVSSDPAEAHQLAQVLDGHNSTRQEHVKRAIADAVERIGIPSEVKSGIAAGVLDPMITVAGDWGPGISGLLASDLVDRYCVPALAGAQRQDGLISVSGRSVAGVNILEILDAARRARPEVFLGGGGHSGACGFTTSPELLEEAFVALGSAARGRVPVDDLTATIPVDAQIGLNQIDMRSLGLVESLGPYGRAFSEPVFLSTRVRLSGRRKMGANGQHLKVTARQGGTKISAIIFSSDPELVDVLEEQPVDIVFNLQRDFYDGLVRPQMHIKDWRLHDEG